RAHGGQHFFLLRIHAFEEFLSSASAERVSEGDLLIHRHGQNFFIALIGREIDQPLHLQVGVETFFALSSRSIFGRSSLGRRRSACHRFGGIRVFILRRTHGV